jgi:four helix bundle protein
MEKRETNRSVPIAGKNDLEERTLAFAVTVVRIVGALPRDLVSSVVGRQLLKSATSIGANYREANRAESREDFIHKTSLAQKEAAETDYWLEICRQSGIGDPAGVAALAKEARELLAILTTINRKAKRR